MQNSSLPSHPHLTPQPRGKVWKKEAKDIHGERQMGKSLSFLLLSQDRILFLAVPKGTCQGLPSRVLRTPGRGPDWGWWQERARGNSLDFPRSDRQGCWENGNHGHILRAVKPLWLEGHYHPTLPLLCQAPGALRPTATLPSAQGALLRMFYPAYLALLVCLLQCLCGISAICVPCEALGTWPESLSQTKFDHLALAKRSKGAGKRNMAATLPS